MTGYRLTAEAVQDIDMIRDYLLTEGGPRLARYVLGRMQTAMGLLGRIPGAGHRREDLTDAAARFWQVFSYLIIYDPAPQPIRIVRVLHGSRDLAALLAKDT